VLKFGYADEYLQLGCSSHGYYLIVWGQCISSILV